MENAKAKKPVVISVLNLKGGVGKTTVTALLARYASGTGGFAMGRGQKNLDVLAVDLDPQANLSQALMGKRGYNDFMGKGREEEKSIVELFKAPDRAQNAVKNVEEGLDIIPSRFDFSDILIESLPTDKEVLFRFIGKEMAHKDLVLIDCAPTESILTRAAYRVSDYVLIPVRSEFFATIGFPLMQKSINKFYDDTSHNINVFVLMNHSVSSGRTRDGEAKRPTFNQQHRDAIMDIRREAANSGWPVLYNQLWHSRGFPKWMEKQTPAHLGNAREEWPPIADEILKIIELSGDMMEDDYIRGAERIRKIECVRGKKTMRELHRYIDSSNSEEEIEQKIEQKMPNIKRYREMLDSVKQIVKRSESQWEKRIKIDKLIVEVIEGIKP